MIALYCFLFATLNVKRKNVDVARKGLMS